jgi:hypothetical protein
LLIFFNFAVLFDFGCCSLAQEMSFVDYYLPYFRQQLITHPLLALLPFHSVFTESSCGEWLLASFSFSSTLSATPPLCCVLVFVCVCWGVSLLRGLCWFIPGVAGGIPHDARHSPIWSAKCLPSMFGAGVWRQ